MFLLHNLCEDMSDTLLRPNPAARQSDALLLPFLNARTEAEAQRALDRVLTEHALPVIRGVVARRMGASPGRKGGGTQSQDEREAEDVQGDALAQLLTRLRTLRSGDGPEDGAEPLADLRAYAAVTAYRACDHRLRQKYPRRYMAQNRLRYLLTKQPGLALWTQDGETVAGFAAWQSGSARPVRGSRLEQLRARPSETVQALLPREDPATMHPARLLAALLEWIGHPARFDELVPICAELWGYRDTPQASQALDEDAEAPYLRAPDPYANTAKQVDQKATLEHLWSEIKELQPRQCAALLLNLRDTQGRGVIALLPILGIASLREIASILGMEPERFAAVWNELPIEDNAIAELLGCTRQQVINLRKVARERLARRARNYEQGV